MYRRFECPDTPTATDIVCATVTTLRCDYVGCGDPHTTVAVYVAADTVDGRITDIRPVCDRHKHYIRPCFNGERHDYNVLFVARTL